MQAFGLLGPEVALVEVGEAADAVAATALGGVERAVGAVESVLSRAVAGVQERGADRDGHRNRDARPNGDRTLGDRLAQAIAEIRYGGLGLHPGSDHAELLAADARDHVPLAHAGAQSAC